MGVGNVMPYFGLCLKDLAFAEENDTMVRVGSVNFHKMRMVAHIIQEIQKAQSSVFNFKKDVKLLTFLTYELANYDDDALFDLSKACEDVTTSATKLTVGKKSIFSGLMRSSSVTKDAPVKTMNPVFGLSSSRSKIPVQLPLRKTASGPTNM